MLSVVKLKVARLNRFSRHTLKSRVNLSNVARRKKIKVTLAGNYDNYEAVQAAVAKEMGNIK